MEACPCLLGAISAHTYSPLKQIEYGVDRDLSMVLGNSTGIPP